MTWNLHLIGTEEVDNTQALAADIAKVVADAGHRLVSAQLTTDAGTVDLGVPEPAPPAPPPEPGVPVDTPPAAPPPADSPPPAADPVA